MAERVAIIQARTGSSRLPGKVMYPLGGRPVLANVVSRVNKADEIDTTVIATSEERQDDIITQFAFSYSTEVYRGSESNVLERFYRASIRYEPDYLVRITADCPLIDPIVIDAVVKTLCESSADYATNILNRSFPRGFDIEAFTMETFETVRDNATSSHDIEHVTPYYRENPDCFELENVTSEEVYSKPYLRDRTDLRLTLDEAADYELLKKVYRGVDYVDTLPVEDAIAYIDKHNLKEINAEVEQKKVSDASDNPS